MTRFRRGPARGESWHRWCCGVLAFGLASPASVGAATTCAVIPVSKSVVETSTAELLEQQLGTTGQFKLVTRTELDAVLREQLVSAALGAGAQYQRAKDFVETKYASCLGLVAFEGGGFSSETISDNACVLCGLTWCAQACTMEWDSVTFGLNTFMDGENVAAATILHEMAHTIGVWNQNECVAYGWEVDTAYCTGLEGEALVEAQQLQQYYCP